MLVSNFELLLNTKQLPSIPGLPSQLEQLGREVIQGYFLTISNLSNKDISLVISFNILIDPEQDRFSPRNISAVLDFDGENTFQDFTRQGPRKRNYTIDVPARDTGLFIVQPNPGLIVPNLATDPVTEIEIRGFVNVSSSSNENGDEIDILLTPEHRGTFYRRITNPGGGTTGFEQLDQIVYTLPTSNGGSLFSL